MQWSSRILPLCLIDRVGPPSAGPVNLPLIRTTFNGLLDSILERRKPIYTLVMPRSFVGLALDIGCRCVFYSALVGFILLCTPVYFCLFGPDLDAVAAPSAYYVVWGVFGPVAPTTSIRTWSAGRPSIYDHAFPCEGMVFHEFTLNVVVTTFWVFPWLLGSRVRFVLLVHLFNFVVQLDFFCSFFSFAGDFPPILFSSFLASCSLFLLPCSRIYLLGASV